MTTQAPEVEQCNAEVSDDSQSTVESDGDAESVAQGIFMHISYTTTNINDISAITCQ